MADCRRRRWAVEWQSSSVILGKGNRIRARANGGLLRHSAFATRLRGQVARRRSCKPKITGSIPVGAFIFGEFRFKLRSGFRSNNPFNRVNVDLPSAHLFFSERFRIWMCVMRFQTQFTQLAIINCCIWHSRKNYIRSAQR